MVGSLRKQPCAPVCLYMMALLHSTRCFGYTLMNPYTHRVSTISVAAQNHLLADSQAYWQQYNYRSPIKKSGGAVYRQSILTNTELQEIQQEVASLMTRLNKEQSSIAQNRMGATLRADSETVRILKEGSLCKMVQKLSRDPTMRLCPDLPVEVRTYEKFGAAMAWHEDDVLYDPPQIEAVVTLENNSDCVTMWKDGDKICSQETDPNSALILEAGGPLHCVTSLKRGRRIILKCAYATADATYREGIYSNQFGPGKKKGVNKKKCGKKR